MNGTYTSEDRIDLIQGWYVSRLDGIWYQHETLNDPSFERVLLRTARSLDKSAPREGDVLGVKIY